LLKNKSNVKEGNNIKIKKLNPSVSGNRPTPDFQNRKEDNLNAVQDVSQINNALLKTHEDE